MSAVLLSKHKVSHAVSRIFNVASNGTQTIGVAPRSSSSNSSVDDHTSSIRRIMGPVIGGVLGAFTLVVLSLAAFYYWIYRPRRTYTRAATASPRIPAQWPAQEKEKGSKPPKSFDPGHIEPFTLMAPSSVQAYRERKRPRSALEPSARRRSPSPKSVVFSQPQDVAVNGLSNTANLSFAPGSYRYHASMESGIPERIVPMRGATVSLASISAHGSGNRSARQSYASAAAEVATVTTMATCG